jgi:uncharacterized protein YkwD
MFRKLWKTIKIFSVLIIILICLPHSILPKQLSGSKSQDIDYFIRLNESETRLSEYKDDTEALKLKLAQLEVINISRKKFRAQPVKLDILASRVANKMSAEAAKNDYVGHWNMAGETPYQRYAFAGGFDHVAENAYGEWTTGSFEISSSSILSMMKKGHGTFMAERAPNDGHKKTIIDKYHNYVGIGYYISEKQFRYYEEFIDRYLEFENIPAEVKVDDTFKLNIKPVGKEYPYYMVVYRENPPKPMTPAQIKRFGSYADFTDEQYKMYTAWELSEFKSGNRYNIPLKLSKEGIYYIHIYLDTKEITKPTTLNTRGRTPASGIVITVRN